eukprot:jgi/Mesvir1/8339/Mv12600-RA.1
MDTGFSSQSTLLIATTSLLIGGYLGHAWSRRATAEKQTEKQASKYADIDAAWAGLRGADFKMVAVGNVSLNTLKTHMSWHSFRVLYTVRVIPNQILVVRQDLKMGKGKIAAQCCHAAVGVFEKMQQRPQLLRRWQQCGQAKVVVKCDTEAELLQLHEEARSLLLPTYVVQDAGRTQIAAGSLTVLAIGPAPVDVLNTVTSHLKLM